MEYCPVAQPVERAAVRQEEMMDAKLILAAFQLEQAVKDAVREMVNIEIRRELNAIVFAWEVMRYFQFPGWEDCN